MKELNKPEKLKLLKLLKQKQIIESRKHHLDFMKYTWRLGKSKPMQTGFHTKIICEQIDQVFKDYRNGISSYVLVELHPRGGKSDLVSRYLPPHFLGEFKNEEVMAVSYSADLSATFSSDAKGIVQSTAYKTLYPGTYIDFKNNARDSWRLFHKDGSSGTNKSSGISSGLNGRGASLLIVDDHTASRADAESKTMRDKTWSAFTDDALSRLAPVHIVFVIATSWHNDDLNQRIKKEMIKNPDFPQFKVLSFPARARDYTGDGEYPNEFLFEERYGKKWYLMKYATMGKYSAAALMDCQPRIKGGEVLNTENIEWLDPDDIRLVHIKSQWYRVYDLAHSAKARAGDDPDYTASTLLSFQFVQGDPVPHLWIKHAYRCREGAVKRDSLIKKWANRDGTFVKQAVETSLDSKDAYHYLRQSMPDISWNKISLQGKGDKLVRATPLEPIFEADKHVHVVRGDWNNAWIDEIDQFNGLGKQHDDWLDNLSAGYIIAVGSGHKMTDEQRAAIRVRNT